MKKTLYSTTALAAAGLLTLGAGNAFAQAAAPAAPEKLKMTIGGFFNAYAGVASQKGSFERSTGQEYSKFDNKNDSEIMFKGSVALDNGMKVSLQVEFETDTAYAGGSSSSTSTYGLDETWLSLDTNGFGELRLGTQKITPLTLGVSAPNSGALNPGNADTTLWIVRPSAGVSAGAASGAIGYPSGSDQNRVVYLSPSISGFRFGADYQASTTDSDQQPVITGTTAQARSMDAVVQYSGAIGDYGFRTSAALLHGDGLTTSATTGVEFGADVKLGDFTVGGLWHRNWGQADSATGATTGTSAEQYAFNAGVAYNPGPWKVGVYAANTWAEGDRANANVDSVKMYKLGANYVLGPGVQLTGDLFHETWQDEADAVTASNSGWALVGGIAVTF